MEMILVSHPWQALAAEAGNFRMQIYRLLDKSYNIKQCVRFARLSKCGF